MNATDFIDKSIKLPQGQDYTLLRQKGLEYIQKFSSDWWTDYNSHDPGITILELLCYAITELSYRTQLPIEDLLARESQSIRDFFTAREILPCNPVTFDDLRKIIIDVPGVENAWVRGFESPVFHIVCNARDQKQLISLPKGEQGDRSLMGLYRFDLLLEEDPELGDLNLLSVDSEIRNSLGVRLALAHFTFPFTLSRSYPLTQNLTLVEELIKASQWEITGVTIDTVRNQIDLDVNLDGVPRKISGISYTLRPYSSLIPASSLETELVTFLTLLQAPSFVNARNLLTRIVAKLKKASGILDEVYCRYQRVRNLCEDVYQIGIVPTRELALCADIEVEGAPDLEEILGILFQRVDDFLSPPVRFHSLKDLHEKKVDISEAFEGPVLTHGFLTQEQLNRSSLVDELNTSDLYREIMKIPGVKSIRHLQVTHYKDGVAQTEGERWVVNFGEAVHLNLDRLRSKIIFYKGDLPITASGTVAERIYRDQKLVGRRPRLPVAEDVPVPTGRYDNLAEYYSIQNDLPRIYGVGPEGIPAGTTMEEQSKMRQLKAYLLFFDQLLANFLSQLASAKDLFAMGSLPSATYFTQPVFDLTASTSPNFFNTEPLLVDKNAYLSELNRLANQTDRNHERINRFKDHLLARFAETFADYALMTYQLQENSLVVKTGEQLAREKTEFLRAYPTLSFNRGRGQYYKECLSMGPQSGGDNLLYFSRSELPDPANPTGLHLRAGRLLGFSTFSNESLVTGRFSVQERRSKFRFVVFFGAGLRLRSRFKYQNEKEAFEGIEKLTSLLVENEARHFKVNRNGSQFYIRAGKSKFVWATSTYFTDKSQALRSLEELKKTLRHEGMFILEHLLLRPLPGSAEIPIPRHPSLPNGEPDPDYGFWPLCEELNPDCECPTTDPYSFRISVVLPYWTPRFLNISFRKFIEDGIHRETPAHVLPKFCWVSIYDMYRLETAYANWFRENRKYRVNLAALQPLLLELVKRLNTLTNIYPEGHLHDCENPSPDNPVILNQTMLGTY